MVNRFRNLFILFLAWTSYLYAQVDSYRLDSINIKTNKQENEYKTEIRHKENFLPVFRSLFGIGLELGYEYSKGDYYFDKMFNKKLHIGQGDVPVNHLFNDMPANYQFNDGLIKIKIHTPVIVLEQSFNFNHFSNNFEHNRRYESTHLNFIGLMRLELFFKRKKYNYRFDEMLRGDVSKELPVGLFPIIDIRKIRSFNYDETYSRFGLFGSFAGKVKHHEVIKNVTFVADNFQYINSNIDISRNGWHFSMQHGFDFLRELFSYTGELAISYGYIIDAAANKRLMNFIPLPIVNTIVKANVKISDENGNELLSFNTKDDISFKYDRGWEAIAGPAGIRYDFGLDYLGFFSLPRIHGLFTPRIQWIYPNNFRFGANLRVCF